MLLAGDPYLYGPEGHFVVRADHEDAFDVLLADLLGRLGLAEADRRVALLERLVLADRQRDDRNRQHAASRLSVMILAVAEKSGRVSGGAFSSWIVTS